MRSIITKFSTQISSYIYQKFHLRSQWGQTPDWGCGPLIPILEVPPKTYCSCFDGVCSRCVRMSTDQRSNVDDIASVIWWLLGDVWCRQSHVSWLCPYSGCRCIRWTLWWLQRNTSLLVNIVFCCSYWQTSEQIFVADVTKINLYYMPHHNRPTTFKTIL